jgi:hypothetical protein
VADADKLTEWLAANVCEVERRPELVRDELLVWCCAEAATCWSRSPRSAPPAASHHWSRGSRKNGTGIGATRGLRGRWWRP